MAQTLFRQPGSVVGPNPTAQRRQALGVHSETMELISEQALNVRARLTSANSGSKGGVAVPPHQSTEPEMPSICQSSVTY